MFPPAFLIDFSSIFLKDEFLEMFIRFEHLCFWVPSFRVLNITFLELPVAGFVSAQP